MLWLGILLGLIGSFVAGLGWGGNGRKKDYILFFGFVLMILPGGYFTFIGGGWIACLMYIFIVSGLTRQVAGWFAKKYGVQL